MFDQRNNLVVSNQIIVDLQRAPHPSAGLNGRAVAFVHECITNTLFQICEHTKWTEVLDSPLMQSLQDSPYFTRQAIRSHPDFTEIGVDEIPASELELLLHRSLIVAFDRKASRSLTYYGKCVHCRTEFEIGTQEEPELGRLFVMTTWKDFGGPSDFNRYHDLAAGDFAVREGFERAGGRKGEPLANLEPLVSSLRKICRRCTPIDQKQYRIFFEGR